jgi:hypothetical protein
MALSSAVVHLQSGHGLDDITLVTEGARSVTSMALIGRKGLGDSRQDNSICARSLTGCQLAVKLNVSGLRGRVLPLAVRLREPWAR